MKGSTHTTIGVAVGGALALATNAEPGQAIMMVVAALTTSKLPDIDLNLPIAHRGITHSLLALAAVYVGSFMLFPHFVAFAALAGYASHIAADIVTRNGVMLFYPLPHKLRLGLMSTGSNTEAIFRLMMMGLILLMLFQFIMYPMT